MSVHVINGWAGDSDILWKYNLGVSRLRELGLEVIAAFNALRGSDYLSKNPKARAEDIMWTFENKDVHAVIANIGGNDSIKLIPYIETKSISENPKILIGYSDVMNLHLLCYHCGLSSFYGDNLLNPIVDQSNWHEYSRKWFVKALFDASPIGQITPSPDWTFESADLMSILTVKELTIPTAEAKRYKEKYSTRQTDWRTYGIDGACGNPYRTNSGRF